MMNRTVLVFIQHLLVCPDAVTVAQTESELRQVLSTCILEALSLSYLQRSQDLKDLI